MMEYYSQGNSYSAPFIFPSSEKSKDFSSGSDFVRSFSLDVYPGFWRSIGSFVLHLIVAIGYASLVAPYVETFMNSTSKSENPDKVPENFKMAKMGITFIYGISWVDLILVPGEDIVFLFYYLYPPGIGRWTIQIISCILFGFIHITYKKWYACAALIIPQFLYLCIHPTIYTLCITHLLIDVMLYGIIYLSLNLTIQDIVKNGMRDEFKKYMAQDNDDCFIRTIPLNIELNHEEKKD